MGSRRSGKYAPVQTVFMAVREMTPDPRLDSDLLSVGLRD
jgi:hypothetical protein